jgi:hypothetical protein
MAKHKTDWFKEAKWGVFTHYLTTQDVSADDWNRRVDAFDVNRLAEQIESVGAKYYFITIGQNSGHYCAPNSVYDELVRIKPSKCSRRDLILDIADALKPKGIRLMVYLPSGGPAKDAVAHERLKWVEAPWPKGNGMRLAEFQAMWESVIREWSKRWGAKVSGWWLDGCYFADDMYRFPNQPNFESFAAALKAGNADSLVAFNPGVTVPVVSVTEYEDYTAGEISDSLPICPGRWINKAQYHILSYLGDFWSDGHPRFSDELVRYYTQDVNRKGGVVTWDVPISKEGIIPKEFLRQLKGLSSKS